ncbi:Agenet domain [Musa troglodytarum]|uniref:Agenet domain n=1 Tax=Musa troglodytarum TaxID=320322 RepID=A0A9E7FTI1_9LILI|nr:Agenet domain [Musa troglodytarum]
MDCDDNDFQNENFQLIGEDNDGFPRSLQSYAPKFDIDDHFQTHLRFDSLSETGLLLGIQGEENNWIEEFSPRNSAIEFGSSASHTCSLSRHDINWSSAPSSESVQMLVKSVEKDEKVSPQIMNTEAEVHAIEDSAICGTNDITHTDSGLLTDKLHNSILASNENVEQHEVTSQTPTDKKSEAGLAVSPSDKKFHSSAEVVASQCTAKEGLISSSGDVCKAYLVSSELLEVVQSKEPLDNTSTMSSSLNDRASAVNKDTEVSSNFVSHNIQNDLSGLSTVNAGMITEKLDNPLFSEQKMEECYVVDISKRSETLQSENKQNETSYNLYDDCKVNDQHFQDQVNNHVCDVKDSSELVSSAESLMLPNDGSNSTVLIQNSGGLLEAFACQVQVSNKDLMTGDKSLTCTTEVPSLAMEKDGIVGRNSVGVDIENTRELSDIAEGPIYFRHDVHEYISEEGGVNPHAPATKDIIALEEERDLATAKAVINDNNCNELRRSDMAVEVTAMKAEIGTAGVDSDKDCKIDTLISKKSDSVPIEKSAEDECLKSIDEKSISTEESAEDECLKSIAENPTGKLDAPGHAILSEPCAALLDDTENKLSSPVHDKLDTSSLVAEHNENNVIHSEEKESTAQLIDSSGMTLKDCSTATEDTEISSFETQNNVADLASGCLTLPSSDNSMILQQLHSEVEVVVELKEVAPLSIPASGCDEKNVNTSSLSVTKSSMDNQISKQQFVVPDSDANVPSVKNFSDNLETANSDEVWVGSSDGVSSLVTCPSTEGKDTDLVRTNNCDKPKHTETEIAALNSERNNYPQSTLPESNLESSLLDPDGGNLSSSEPNCGSPTVISCNQSIMEKMEHRESNSPLQDCAGSALTKNSDILKFTVQDSKVSITSEEDGNFTFVVQPDADFSQKDSNKDLTLFSNTQSFEQPQISTETSQGYLSEGVNESTRTISKTIVEDKSGKVSVQATKKVGILKGDAKEKSHDFRGKGRKKNPCSTSPVPERATRSKSQREGMQQCLSVETNTANPSCFPSVQTSNLPDLNTSAPTQFHQPFTDLQQVQLRAQIFVYGSLIQGVLPDEACMVPAFGGSDGGRSLWERAWRASSERFYNLKSSSISSGAHLHHHSEQGISCSPLPGKVLDSPGGWKDNKVPSSAIQSSTVSLQSAFQTSSNDGLHSNITRGIHLESGQSLSPMHPYQTSQIKQYMTNSTPWLSQCPHPASWSFSSQSLPVDSTSQYSAMLVSETAPVTPVRDSSIPCASNMQLASTGTLLTNQDATRVSAALVVPFETQNREATPVNTKNTVVSEKSRKRKKVSAPEELVPKFSVSQLQAESASAAFTTNNLPNSVGLSLSSNSLSTVTSSGLVSTTTHPITMPYYQILGSGHTQQRVTFSKETCIQIEHTKLQAENASAYAAAAVRHGQVIWEQMVAQRKLGLASEVEQKLASAAAAAAAAASVAKAAAEVAKVASDASLQAKLMVDDALSSSNTGSTIKNSEISFDVGKNLLTSTPVSSSKSKDKIRGPYSIISEARETTRKRVEAASAAIKRAENLDAILKAAEMAAEAVSQVGTIIAMGDPLPFSISELVEAGPEGHWNIRCAGIKKGIETNGVHAGDNLALDVAVDLEVNTRQSIKQPLTCNEGQKVSIVEGMPPNNKKSLFLEENSEECELENESRTVPTDGAARDAMQGSSIQKGSLVEVVADGDGLRGAWFSARVLDLKDGKAYVCYDGLSDEDNDKLKEWIPLESKSDQPPRIRVGHPVIVAKSEGTRKRRREAVGNFTWAIGDRVDAFIRDGWWEGIVTEKNQDDETKLTVHFPAGGNSSIVRAWNLRPSLIWKDGRWVEWSQAKERVTLEPYESVPGIPSSKKKSTTVVAEMEDKRRVLSAVDKFSRSEVKGSENPGTRSADVIEPRRSNRRIQPTSRLLEGLQSSLIVAKGGPGVSHERGPKTLHRGVSTARGQSHE